MNYWQAICCLLSKDSSCRHKLGPSPLPKSKPNNDTTEGILVQGHYSGGRKSDKLLIQWNTDPVKHGECIKSFKNLQKYRLNHITKS